MSEPPLHMQVEGGGRSREERRVYRGTSVTHHLQTHHLQTHLQTYLIICRRSLGGGAYTAAVPVLKQVSPHDNTNMRSY
jgi:hypothetical protein